MARCKYCHRPLRSPSSVMRGVGDNCARSHQDGCIYLDSAYFNHKQLSLLDLNPVIDLSDKFGLEDGDPALISMIIQHQTLLSTGPVFTEMSPA